MEGFVYLQDIIPDIICDMRYAASNNLTGKPLDGYLANTPIGTREMAQALKRVAEDAREQGYRLHVFDAYRPQKAVDCFVRWAKEPEDDTTREAYYPKLKKEDLFPLGYIALKSGHTRGSTVDLTLVDGDILLDMGTDFDFMDEMSHHGAAGIMALQAKNRLLLLNFMTHRGFLPYENEWWHYRLDNEPYPDTYFDFDVK